MGLFKPNVDKMEAEKDVQGLMKMILKSRDLDIIVNAIGALGEIRDSRAVGLLIQALQVDNEYVRGAAAMALINIRDSKAVEPLIQIIKNENREDVRKWAAVVLRKTGWVPKNDIEKAWCLAVKGDWEELFKMGEPAVEPLIQALYDKDKEKTNVQWKAAMALGEIRNARAVEALLRGLSYHSYTGVQPAAEAALKRIKDSGVVEPFIQALKSKNSDVRCYAAVALGEIRDPRAIEPLTQALHDEKKYVHWAVDKALRETRLKPKYK